MYLPALLINRTTLFCHLKIILLSQFPPPPPHHKKRSMLYLKCEWRFAKYIPLKIAYIFYLNFPVDIFSELETQKFFFVFVLNTHLIKPNLGYFVLRSVKQCCCSFLRIS